MPEIFQMDRVDRVADILYGVAVGQGLIGYGPLARRIGMQPHHLGHPLDQVSKRAVIKGEPLWSALVVGKDSQRPHVGFYGLARGLRPEYADLDDETLWEKERDRCYKAALQTTASSPSKALDPVLVPSADPFWSRTSLRGRGRLRLPISMLTCSERGGSCAFSGTHNDHHRSRASGTA